MTDADYADDFALLVNAPARAKYKSLLLCLEQGTGGIDFYMNTNKMVNVF